VELSSEVCSSLRSENIQESIQGDTLLIVIEKKGNERISQQVPGKNV
jgi:hypothetical protein